MEEEGTVVYYEVSITDIGVQVYTQITTQGSPGALEVHGGVNDELVVKREECVFSDSPSDPVQGREGTGLKTLDRWVQLVWHFFGSWTIREVISYQTIALQ